MKDTQAMETCVSPKPISAESPWFKKTAIIRPYHGVPFRRTFMQSWREPVASTTGQVVLRIADAPCDSKQGATEPERVITASHAEKYEEKPFASETEKPLCRDDAALSPASTTNPQQTQRTISTFTSISHAGGEERRFTADGETLKKTPKHKPRTWTQGLPYADHGHKTHESLSTATHSNPLTTLSHEHQKDTSNLVQYSTPYPRSHHSTLTPATEGRPGNNRDAASSLNPRKPSNLSEIERQRGPLKKRHIHFQPEVLDLSVKRLKSEPGSNVGQIKNEQFLTSCVQSSQSVGVKPAHRQFNEGFYTTVKQEQPSEVTEMGKPETHAFRGVFRTGEALDMESRDGNIHSGQRPLLPSIPGFKPGELTHGTYTGAFSSVYSPGGMPVPQYNRELVRRWVLHVTQNNEIGAMQHLQAQVIPNFESNQSAASDASHGKSLSTFTVGKRGQRSTVSPHEKPYACDHCSSTFKHRHHVIRHMRAHNGERPFHCPDCGAAFARKCVLTNHRRTHTGEKPYICSECGDTFSRKHHLVIHQRTHSGEKPYRCLDCGAAFARSHHVNRHRRTHEQANEKAPEEGDNVSLCTTRSQSTSDIEQLQKTPLTNPGTELMVPPSIGTNVTADARNEHALPTAPGSPSVLAESGTQRSPTYTLNTPITHPSENVGPQNGQV